MGRGGAGADCGGGGGVGGTRIFTLCKNSHSFFLIFNLAITDTFTHPTPKLYVSIRTSLP